MPKSLLVRGDALEMLRTLPEGSMDACVTDPPYELGFMGKAWDRNEGCEGLEDKLFGQSNAAKAALARGESYANSGNGMNTTKVVKNNHPTVKPTELMRYLIRLVTPPGGTVLDPFMGSGSTGKAAALEGFGFVGIELSEQYVAIARARIAHGSGQLVDVLKEAA